VPVDPATALLYVPKALDRLAPAIVVVRPHEDPKASEPQALARSLAALGFIVVSLDLRTNDSAANLLPNGIVPEGLAQRSIRSAVLYLLSRHDVDGTRLGIVGTALDALIAAAINPQFSVIVLSDSAPDFKEQIGLMRHREGQTAPDLSGLIPGILHYAAAEDLFAMIAPRPVLAVNPAPTVFQHATDLYSSFGASESLRQVNGIGEERESWHATSAWLARWLQDQPDLVSVPEPDTSIQAAAVSLPQVEVLATLQRRSVSKMDLAALLGGPLPESRITVALQCAPQQRILLQTEPGLDVPATVFRPGPEGCDAERGILVAVNDKGRDLLATDEIVQEELHRGWEVWAIDPRGIGELKSDNEGFIFAMSLLLGENFVWRQASDIIRIIAQASNSTSTHRVALYACGKETSLAAAYAAATADSHELPEWVVMRQAVLSFSTATDVEPHFWPFDTLNTFDIPDLISAARPRTVSITRPEEVLQYDWSW
jgi:hypothetical protein